ncbi:hypothetical protein GCM10010193_11790 [Kitasatospora atroaurantiaca]|uniref:Putative adhesin n=1 Tax=Kitasatospora atroaurantiaca TaxID=285545 RepID=A0A561EQH6_9ACTN|nr:DUF4097 family beta strand repeat-containing protein [Kitasatospora atroaurantiaca]TWE17871.1 putative adhesin [Kitasatospora atroaurantiaca]
MNRPLARVAMYAGITAVVVGAGVSGYWLEEKESRDVAYGVDQAVRVLVVEASTGDVEVVGGGGGVQVVERQEFRGKAPVATHEVTGGTLTLTYHCGDCSVGYRVRVPEGTVVRVHGSTGDVRLTGLTGEVVAESSTGTVVAKGLGSTSARLVSSTGDVSASFTTAPTEVTATSSTGSVRVTVPSGQPYAVDASTGVGDVQVSVPRKVDAGRSIEARTATGDVTVNGG